MDSSIGELHRLFTTSRLKREVISIVSSLYNKIFSEHSKDQINQDFVNVFESLIDEVLLNLSRLLTKKLDKYKFGQLVVSLLHDSILNRNSTEKQQCVESQIDNFEYDICQNSIVRLFGLLSNETLRRIIFTTINDTKLHQKKDLYQNGFPSSLYKNSPQSRNTAGLSLEEFIASSSSTLSSGENIKTTSALYTLIIAILTKAVFMPIIDNISDPKFLLASIIWVCKKEERERLKKSESLLKTQHSPRRQDQKQSLKTANTNPIPSTSIVVTNTRGMRSLDLEEGYDIASANINFISPICGSLKRPLENIEIFSTEEVRSNNSCYILYCIRYDGLCYRHPSAGSFSFIPDNNMDRPIIDKRQTHSIKRKNNEVIRLSNRDQQNVSNRKSFRRSMVVKRRFREFVLLQLRLEENPKTRIFMGKNIPKPTKLKAATQNIFSLPGITNIKLDQSTIRIRQRFLERFLIALNNSPFISNSYEFKEFFSYSVNPVGMSKSKSTILQVNLNKVFVDSVKSAFTMIRSTLPGDDYQSLRSTSNTDPDAWLTELQQSTLKLHIQTRTSQSKMNLERLIDVKLSSFDDSPTRLNLRKSSSLGKYYQDQRQAQATNSFGGPFEETGGNRGGSLKARLSSSSLSSSVFISRSSSSYSNSHNVETTSKSVSDETIYHDASDELGEKESGLLATSRQDTNSTNAENSIQICDNFPIASKFIDIVHYSINQNPTCSNSIINFVARFVLGRMIEKHAIRLLSAAVTFDNTEFCLSGIASSIWDESVEDPPLDIEHANLEEAVENLTTLVQHNIVKCTYIPKQMLRGLIRRQIRFYLTQLESKKQNKFVIYSFFVQLLDELEID